MDEAPSNVLLTFLKRDALVNDHTSSVWPCFIGFMPDDSNSTPKERLCLYDTGGITRSKLSNGVVVQYPSIQIMIKGAGYLETHQKLVTIRNKIDSYKYDYVKLGDNYYAILNAKRSSPILPLGKDMGTKRLFVFTLNYNISLAIVNEDGTAIQGSEDLHTLIHTTFPAMF